MGGVLATPRAASVAGGGVLATPRAREGPGSEGSLLRRVPRQVLERPSQTWAGPARTSYNALKNLVAMIAADKIPCCTVIAHSYVRNHTFTAHDEWVMPTFRTGEKCPTSIRATLKNIIIQRHIHAHNIRTIEVCGRGRGLVGRTGAGDVQERLARHTPRRAPKSPRGPRGLGARPIRENASGRSSSAVSVPGKRERCGSDAGGAMRGSRESTAESGSAAKNMEGSIALFKAGFPMIFSALAGDGTAWTGMDDYQPFWLQRKIMEAAWLPAFIQLS